MAPNNITAPSSFQVVPLWFSSAAIAGVGTWIWGTSEWPMHLFIFTFGVSTFTLVLLIFLTALFLLGRLTWKRAHHAQNDFSNFGPRVLGRLQRGVSALLGLALVTLMAWVSIGSHSGAKLTLLCGLFAICLQWCAYCVQIMLTTQASTK